MAPDREAKKEGSSESPVSVLGDEEKIGTELDDDVLLSLEVEDGITSHITKTMVEEERNLMEIRCKEEVQDSEDIGRSGSLEESEFSRLDELLNKTQMYSNFLLEQMDKFTEDGVEQGDNEATIGEKKGWGSKRKASRQCHSRQEKRALAAMQTRAEEEAGSEDVNLTEEEIASKYQARLVPSLTGGKLKSYQINGVKWLISLWKNGLNGILADQMGLGKTIQTIGFLGHLKSKDMHGPFLVIAPLSTLANWHSEILRFTPSIKSIIYHGNAKERNEIRRKHMPKVAGSDFPIVITSYEIAINDANKGLKHYKWKYLVVDEGHRLKNSDCQLRKELKRLTVENKLLLTGMPLQNNLAELWTLLNFILPDIFSSHAEFESWFDLAGKCSNDTLVEEMQDKRKAQVVAKLHAILRPFFLRRMKADVELMLPGKKEIILYATMTDHQRNFQDHLLNKTLEDYLQEKFSTGRSTRKKLNNMMIQLRKNCYHPDLLEYAYDDSYDYPPLEEIVGKCGKFRLLDRLLTRLLSLKHKVLIFSQWTKVLDIMDYYFSEKGLRVCRIDGSVKLDERRKQINEFNVVNSDFRIFLLSTRAGGLGIDLTAADTCIVYDGDWNPQMDLQAMDRCHNIGQTKPVHVYRLVTAQSIEGRILKRVFSMLKLEHVVIGKGQFKQENSKPTGLETLKEDELLALLRDEEDPDEKITQREISDEDLERVLDRSNLVTSSDENGAKASPPAESFPLKGPGWEVVAPTATGGVLSTING